MKVLLCVRHFALTVFCLSVWSCASVAMAGGGLPKAPEIDPGSLASAIALVSGGVAMIADRYRRKNRFLSDIGTANRTGRT